MISNITRDIQDVLDIPIHKEGNYSAFTSGSVECETGEFLYGLVRILKPDTILETGTYHGISSLYMGLALKENGKGKITTLEYIKEHIEIAKGYINTLELQDYIQIEHGSSLDYQPSQMFDIQFLDSEPEIRFKELIRFYEYLKPGGFVMIHDLPRGLAQGNINPDHPSFSSWPYGDVPLKMKDLLQSGDLTLSHLYNPREMGLFYKRHPGDYKI